MRVVLFLAATLAGQPQRAITVNVHDTFVMNVFGATAAYVVDPNVAEVAVYNGNVSVFGRAAGKTQLVVVSITGQTTFEVNVPPRAGMQQPAAAQRGGSGARIESRYVSPRQEVHNTVDVVSETAKKRTQVHVENISGRTPSVSYSVFTARGSKRELTFLDRVVDHSPLTISTGTVRGFHYLDDRWRIHAGYTAYAAYQAFLLPTERERVLGVAYSIPVSSHLRVTPGIFNSIASLLLDYTPDDKTKARGELGYSNGSFGAAAELSLEREHHHLHADLRYRPREFATITPGQPRGFFADAVSSANFGRTSLDTAVSASQRSLSASFNARVQLTDSLSLLGSVQYGAFDSTRTLLAPAGVQYETPHFGATALYRYGRAGNGYRLAARASAGRVFATAFVDHQEQAPTLALIFREEPELALALAQLGITATTPADIARALRENSALVDLGFIEGVTVDLAPSRSQAGFEIAWLSAGPSRAQLRARVLVNRIETVSRSNETMIATLSGSRRISDSTDIFASYTRWITNDIARPIFELGFRHRFDSLPAFGNGTISGSVFIDDDLDGKPDGGGIADAEIEVDGAPRVKTTASGSFSVRVPSGAHRVTARVPQIAGAYFTTPSHVEASTGDAVHFGVAVTPARVFGHLTSDAGEGVGGVTIELTRGSSRFTAISGSDGTYSIAAPPGAWELGIDAMSLPAGYSAGEPRPVRLDRDKPLRYALALRANRSITGTVRAGITSVYVSSLGRSVPVGADGRFSIRSLPAGGVTLRARNAVQQITLPNGPAIVEGVDLR